MATYVSLDTFLPEILQYCHGVPTIMARTHIRNSIITFCERSLILKRDPSSFYLDEDEHTYTLKYNSDRYVAVAAKHCQLGEGDNGTRLEETTEHELDNSVNQWRYQEGNKPTKFFLTDETNGIRFYPTPNQDSDDEIFLNTVVKPKRNVTEVDEFLWEKWEETIQAGAISSLLVIPGSSWYNDKVAKEFSKLFKRGYRKARKTAVAGTSEKPAQVVPQSFTVMGQQENYRRYNSWD